MNDLYSQKLTTASLVKFSSSPVRFEHIPGRQKFRSENFEKVQFLQNYFIFVTYLPSEVDGRIMSEIYFWMKIGYEDLRKSRSENLTYAPVFDRKQVSYLRRFSCSSRTLQNTSSVSFRILLKTSRIRQYSSI